jgi:hypothetical protein
MKTKNLNLDFILPEQLNKEVFFNENLLKIDNFICSAIRGFVENIPDAIESGVKFIIDRGENRNKICFLPANGRIWKLIEPQDGMIFFCIDIRAFIYFNGADWIRINMGQETIPERFLPCEGRVAINNKINWLYLNGNTELSLRGSSHPIIEIIIKQNFEEIYNIHFDSRILWKNEEYISSRIPNNIDFIRLVKIPETEHYLGEIVNIGYRY